MDIVDVPRIYKKCMNEWHVWTAPLRTGRWWYSEDYYKETMKAFEQASGGLQIIFMVIPNDQFPTLKV